MHHAPELPRRLALLLPLALAPVLLPALAQEGASATKVNHRVTLDANTTMDLEVQGR
ncbi:MAG: hypothetical protein AB7N76_28165 [Planctomycetota bacterium]